MLNINEFVYYYIEPEHCLLCSLMFLTEGIEFMGKTCNVWFEQQGKQKGKLTITRLLNKYESAAE